jgi:hypothetical protein
MSPSALLPSHDHTVFQFCPAAITPGIAVEGREVGAGGAAALAFEGAAPGIENGGGGVLHFASTLFSPGFCQDCWLLPRGNDDEGL